MLPRLLIGELYKFPELARFYKSTVADRGLALIARAHRRGVAAGRVPAAGQRGRGPPGRRAPLLLAAVWRAVFAPYEDEPFDPQRVLDAHVDTLLRGLAAP